MKTIHSPRVIGCLACLAALLNASAQISTNNLTFWLRADAGLVMDTNNVVSQWNDQAPGSNHLSQASAGNRPVCVSNALNGLPVVRFSEDVLTRASVPGTSLFSNTAATVFVVQKQLGTDGRTTTLSWVAGSDYRFMLHATYDDSIAFQLGQPGSGGSIGVTQPSNWDDNWHFVAVRRDGTNGSIRVDGVEMRDPRTALFTAAGDSSQSATLHVGSDQWGNTFNGDIAELITYNTALADTDRAAVESYLRNKWNLSTAPAAVPDLLIKTASEPEGAYALNGVYQLAPAGGQVKTQAVAALGSAVFNIKVQNDSSWTKPVTLRAVESATSGWSVTYKLGSSNVTAAIVGAGGFTSSNLPPAAELVFNVEFTMTGVASPGTAKTVTVTAWDTYVTNVVRDAVQAVAVAAPGIQPDLMVRRDIDPSPVGDNIYNATGYGQTKWLDVQTNQTATFYVTLANDGNTNAQIKLGGSGGGAGWTVNYFAEALAFDGVDDYVDLGSWTPGNQWTVEAWVKLTSIPGGRHTVVGGANDCRDWGVALLDGRFTVPVQPSGGCWAGYGSTNYAVTNVWYHLAATCDGTNACLYVNGELAATGPSANYAATSYPRIGGEACCGGDYLPGWIRDVRIWGRPLASNEVAFLMNTIPSGNESGLLGWWPLDDGSASLVRDLGPLRRNGTLVNGPAWQRLNITAQVVSAVYSNCVLNPGGTREFVVEITPDGTVANGATNAALLSASVVGDPSRLDAVKMVATAFVRGSTHVNALFTTTADFEKGWLSGVEDWSTPDQLQLSSASGVLPFLWVPNSSDGTVSKMDTLYGRELARYRVCPPSVTGSPSRTTVDLRGNCWVANRQCATVVKIGLLEHGEYLDRNGDGMIQTSRDLNGDGSISSDEMLAWGLDECVLYEVFLAPGNETNYVPGTYLGTYVNNYWNPGPRGVAVDAQGNLWAGTHDTMKYYYIDGGSGRILRIIDTSSNNHTAYGAVIDPRGILWSSGYTEGSPETLLRMNTADGSQTRTVLGFHPYGIAIDRNDHLFLSAHQEALLTRWNTLTGTMDWSVSIGSYGRGVAITDDGDVWVVSSGAGTLTRFSNDGVQKAVIAVGSTPTGVAIDSSGKPWTLGTGDEYLRRINPATDTIDLVKRVSGSHYGYSDMTGVISRNSTTRLGIWSVVHDAQIINTAWQSLTWNGSDVTGTNIVVRVRSSNDRTRWSAWEPAASNSPLLLTPPGRYLEIEVTLRGMPGVAAPVLYNIAANGAAPAPTDLGVALGAAPNPVLNQHALACSITITNHGTNWASGIVVSNPLPASFDVLSVTVPGGFYQLTNNLLVCTLGGLAPRRDVTVSLSIIPQLAGLFTNSAWLVANESDANAANNTNRLAITVSPTACVPPPQGFVAWWPGESNAVDLAGTNIGTPQGGITFAAAEVGNGFTFGSDSDRVVFPHNDAFNPSRSGFTAQFWMKGTKTQPGQSDSLCTILEKSHGWVDYTGWAFQTWPASGLINFNIGDGINSTWPSVSSTVDVLDNRWHHIAGQWDGFTIRFWVDGVLQGSCPLLRPGLNTRPLNMGFTWGNGSPRRFFRGQVDEVAIHDRALASSEIVAIYEARSAGFCASAPFINQPSVFPDAAANKPFSQRITAALGVPPYTFTLQSGSLPPGLTLDPDGLLAGTPSTAGNRVFTVRATDALNQTCQRTYTNTVFACTPVPSGVVGWWPGEDNTDDITGTNHATLEYQAGYNAGKVGRAFLLDGSQDAVRIFGSASGALDITTNQLSIDFWINVAATNPPGSGISCLVDKYWDGSANGYEVTLYGGNLVFHVATASNPMFGLTNYAFPRQRWVHVAATYDGGLARIYQDGVEQASAPLSGNILHNNHNACIGNDNWPGSTEYSLDGLIDEIEIHNRGLSSTEVQSIFQADMAGKCVPTPADLLVKNSGESDTAYTARLVYEPVPGATQTKSQAVYPLFTAAYNVRIENDGPAGRAFVLRSVEIPSTNWTTVYTLAGVDVTAALHSSTGLTTAVIAPGAGLVLAAQITPTLRAPGNSWQSAVVSVYADSRAVTVLDSVKLLTQCRPTSQPDVSIRRETDVNFIGEGITNNNGLNQTKSIEVDAGNIATYRVKLRNSGNTTNRFALTGTSGGGGWTVRYFADWPTLGFNGSSHFVAISNVPLMRLTNVTLEGWYNFDTYGGSRVLFSKALGSGYDDSYVMWHDGGSLRGYVSGGPSLGYGWVPTLGAWYHCAYVFNDASNIHNLYLNGVLVATGGNSTSVSVDSHALLLGADFASDSPSEFFPGRMSEVRLWNVARSQDEILATMNRRLSGGEPGLIGLWHLDDGIGSVAADATANGNNGLLFNGPAWGAPGLPSTNGCDITAEVTGAGCTNLVLPPAATCEILIQITPGAGTPGGTMKELLITATSLGGPAPVDAVKAATTVTPDSVEPVGGSYTSSGDFANNYQESGVDYSTVPGQIQLSTNSATLPFLWVPNSEGTISKVDTRTGRELARYRTGPVSVNSQPSRTTVDLQGNCWVGNRFSGTVVKVGLLENGQFIDRNGNGVADTSRDLNNDGDITGAELLDWGSDECVLFEVSLITGYEGTFVPGTFTGPYQNNWGMPGPRGVAVDAQGNCWVGTLDTKKFYYLSGANGQILRTIDVSAVNHRTYGAVLDRNGILWSASHDRNEVLRLDPVSGVFTVIPLGHFSYGINVDRNDHVFVSGWQDSRLTRIGILTAAIEWSVTGSYESRGLAITDDGDVWIANSAPGTVTRWSNNGLFKATIPAGSAPTGVAVDHEGKVWVLGRGDEYIRRIDPATDSVILTKRIICANTGDGGYHYGYSDMTGNVVRNNTTRIGTWTALHNSRVLNTPWGTVSWHGSEPEGTSLRVRVRSSNNRQTWSNWEIADNARTLHSTPPGKYLEVEVTFQSSAAGITPVLQDLDILPATQASYGVLVYTNDFATAAGPGWSVATTDVTPLGGRRFLGQFGNQTVTLSLSNLPPHAGATVLFDQFIIRSWDGNSPLDGPDLFEMNVGGGLRTVYATFNNAPTNSVGFGQTFPDVYPGATNAPLTGASETNTLGFTVAGMGPMSAVYPHVCGFPHTSSNLVINFIGSGLSTNLSEESWGLDNVRVYVTPVDGPPVLTPIGMSGGTFYLELVNEPGWNYVIQGSDDLFLWSNLYTNRPGTNRITLFDASAPDFTHRFYRAVKEP